MPWLERDKVLFIHVPRAGGTSITSHHRVGEKARAGMDPYHKFGMVYVFYRYKLLESANFPLFTWENVIALSQISIGVLVYFFAPLLWSSVTLWTMACITFTFSTVVWTAPITMRNNVLRYILMIFQSKILCGFGGETKYMVGITDKAYMFHITAKRAIEFGYVTEEQVTKCGFAIVRNPWSRVVSMFEYNRRPFETFESFVESFYRDYVNIYLKKDTCECKDIYCHILPMHEYTHIGQDQVVGCIIKQEHLKHLVASGFKMSNVPEAVQRALTGIPHANRRKRRRPWQQYYNQHTMELVYRMYHQDFKLFGYVTEIKGRSDLVLPEQVLYEVATQVHKELDAASSVAGTAAAQSESAARDHVYVEMNNVDQDAAGELEGGAEDDDQGNERAEGLEKRFLPKTTAPRKDAPAVESASSYVPPKNFALELTEEDIMRRKASVFVLADA